MNTANVFHLRARVHFSAAAPYQSNTRAHCLICLSTRVVLVGFGYHSQTSIRLGGVGPLRFRCTCVPQEYVEACVRAFRI